MMSASRESVHVRKHNTSLSTRSVLLLTLAGCGLLLAPSILWDFAYDQGTFAYGGSAILRGAVPYIDFWDIKPPNVFYTYATAFSLFGESIRAIRIFDYITVLTTLFLIYFLSIRLWTGTPWGRLAAVMACIAFSLEYWIQGPWNTAQAEMHALPWILGAVLLELPSASETTRDRLIKLGIAGFAIAIAFFFKYTNGIFLILIAGMLWLTTANRKEQHGAQLLALAAGFVVGMALQLAHLAITGQLAVLWHIATDSTIRYSQANYSGSFGVTDNIRTAVQNLDMFWVVVAIIGWSFWGMDEHNRMRHTEMTFRAVMVLLLACALSLTAIQLQNKGYTYHYLILLPWASIIIGAGIAHLAKVLHRLDALPRGSNAGMLVLILFVGSIFWTSASALRPLLRDMASVLKGERAANGYIEGDTLANYVSNNTRPTDRIFIFGFEPYVYWKSGRRPATRFLNTIHFKPSYAPFEERIELVSSLKQRPPELFLAQQFDEYTSQGDSHLDSRTTIRERYPEIEKLLADRYEARDTVQHMIAYYLIR